MAALSIGGCASKPVITTLTSGTPPAAGTGIAIADDGAQLDKGVRDLAATRLAAMGFGPGTGLTMRISVVDRPAMTGTYVPPATPDAAPAWLYQPVGTRPKGGIHNVTLTLTDEASGRETYRAAVSEAYRRSKDDQWRTRLAEQAVALLSPEAAAAAAPTPAVRN